MTSATRDQLLIEVTDPCDPAIAEFRSIRERDLVKNTSRFIAEGTVVLNMLAAAHRAGGAFRAEKILVLENRIAGIASLLESFPEDVPIYRAKADVIDAIAGFHLHRGVLALGARQAPTSLDSLLTGLPPRALVTICCGISNHDNVGAIFRNSAAFGSSLVILDEASCDPLYRKALRVSVGSVLSVPYWRGGTIEEIIASLSEAGFAIWGLSPRGKTDIRQVPESARTALLLGTEGEGLPQALLDKLNTAAIRQKPGLDSLNVATAGAIALYEMACHMATID